MQPRHLIELRNQAQPAASIAGGNIEGRSNISMIKKYHEFLYFKKFPLSMMLELPIPKTSCHSGYWSALLHEAI